MQTGPGKRSFGLKDFVWKGHMPLERGSLSASRLSSTMVSSILLQCGWSGPTYKAMKQFCGPLDCREPSTFVCWGSIGAHKIKIQDNKLTCSADCVFSLPTVRSFWFPEAMGDRQPGRGQLRVPS